MNSGWKQLHCRRGETGSVELEKETEYIWITSLPETALQR
jgi:hypothetical protein